ncbi:MAG TPA: hypothetical protein PK263_04540 [bacterium]|nr:hypothetical protein [bacterium]
MKYSLHKNKQLTYLLVITVLLITAFAASIPLRKKWSESRVKLGDSYLTQKKYVSAALEYNKAMLLNKDSKTANAHKTLATESASNILKLEEFYKKENVQMALENFDKAKAIPKDEVIATKTARELIEKEEYQLAIISATTATQLEPSYRDGWLYLGIANLKTLQNVELPQEAKNVYLQQAQKALEKAKSLDPQYKPTLDFLGELEKARDGN